MRIDGRCLCGDVTWRAEIDPESVGICHCTQCQVNGASAFQWAARVTSENFELLTGKLKVYVKTAESGNERALSFCPKCGTTIHGGNAGKTGLYSLRLGGCTQRNLLEPTLQLWCRSAVPWIKELAVGKRVDTQSGLPR